MTQTQKNQSRSEISKTDSELNELIIESIRDIKGKDIVKIDLRELYDSPADFFIICSGDSTTQVKAIAENIEKRVKEKIKEFPISVEGKTESRWVLLDYFDTVVHVFYPETRFFYELEELWSDGLVTEYQDI